MKIPGKQGASWGILSLLGLLMIASCGGAPGTGGVGGTGIGPVAGFGTVIVNGVRYAADNATIVIGGVENRPESELKVGMRVRVDGPFSATGNTGTATRIEAIREVRGPMDDNGVDNVLNRLRAAGQTVLVDPATVFDNVADLPALQAIQSGTLRHPEVEVHGAADDNGFIHATYVRIAADDFRLTDDVSVRGKIRNFNGTLRTFTIGGQAVAYPLLGLEKVPPGAVFGDGISVDVRGILTSAGGTGILNANRIEVLDNTIGANNDPVRVEGYVVSVPSPNSFVLLGPGGNVSVDGVSATLVPAGGAIGVGRKVQVEGVVTGAVLKASVIRIRPANSVRMEGVGGQVDLSSNTFRVFSKTVQVDGYTLFQDEAGGTRTLGLSSLFSDPLATDNVQVVGSFDGSKVDAVLVERIVPADPGLVLLQGPVDNNSIDPVLGFRIMGIQITSVRDFANTGFGDARGESVTRAEFFAVVLPRLRPDQVVKVKRGVFLDGSPTGSLSLVRDDSDTSTMEVGIEQINE